MKKWQRLKQLSEAGKIGGKARAKELSPERRKKIASEAANARWAFYYANKIKNMTNPKPSPLNPNGGK